MDFTRFLLQKGEYEIEISYIGYQSIQKHITLNQNTKSNFSISEGNGEELQEVVITENKGKINVKSPEMSVNKLSITTIKKCLLF